MGIIGSNIKFLRKKYGHTQESFAQLIGVKRPVIGAYEEERAEPKIPTLKLIGDHFGLSVDALINEDLSRLPESAFDNIKVDLTGDKMRVLTVSVDNHDRENIELVPQKAAAGYSTGYADTEYIEELPKLYLPMLSGGTHRGFEIVGDSMLPLLSGTIVIGSFLENWHEIKDGRTYVVVTKDDGAVYKRVTNNIYSNGTLNLVSDNRTYDPYEVSVDDVVEIWESKLYISKDFPDGSENDTNVNDLAKTVLQLQKEMEKLKGGSANE